MKEFGKIIVVVFCLGVLLLLAYNIHLRNVALKQLQELNASNASALASPGASSTGSTVNVYENQGSNSSGVGSTAFLPLTFFPIWSGSDGYDETNTANVSRSAEVNNYDRQGSYNRGDFNGQRGNAEARGEARGRGGRR